MINPHIIKTPFHPSVSISKQSSNIIEPKVHSVPRQHIYSYYQEPLTEKELIKYTSSIPVHFRAVETQNPLNKFISTLNSEERNIFQKSVEDIKNFPFVNKIEFDELETPTLIIRISELNREYEEIIFDIQYNLLNKLQADIDFLILPD